MPRLPDSNAFGQRPVPLNRQGIAGQDTASSGEAMARLGQVIAQAGEEVAKVNDEQAYFDFRGKVGEIERSLVYDPTTGVRSKLGKDAFDLPDKVMKRFDEQTAALFEGLRGNRQKRAAQELLLSRRTQVADFTLNHAFQQKEIYARGQMESNVSASADRAAMLASAGNAGGAKAEMDAAAAELTGFLSSRGVSGEEIAARLLEQSSKTHSAAIHAMLNNGDPVGAKAYLDANSGGMMQADITRASGVLKEGVLRQKSQAFADDVMGKGLSMADALKTAREKLTGDEETAAVQEIKIRYSEGEAALALQQKRAADAAWRVMANGGIRKQIPVQVWDQLAGEEQRQINDYEVARAQRARLDAENREPDPSVYYKLRMMAAEDPAAFSRLDIMKVAPMLSKAHENRLIDIQAGISKADAKVMESQKILKATSDMLRNEIAAAGIDAKLTDKDAGTKKGKETLAFFGALSTSLDQAAAVKGSPLTTEEARRIGLNLLREGVEQGTGFGVDTWYKPWNWKENRRRGYQIATDASIEPSTSFIAARFDDIPADRRDALVSTLYPTGAPRTPYGGLKLTEADKQKIEAAYTRALNAGYYK